MKGEKTPTQLGLLEKLISITGLALSKGLNRVGVFSLLHLRTETDPVSIL
jgi:hypothetical protein